MVYIKALTLKTYHRILAMNLFDSHNLEMHHENSEKYHEDLALKICSVVVS